jgi:hypothetical protein
MIRVHAPNEAGKRPHSKAEASPGPGLLAGGGGTLSSSMSVSLAAKPLHPPTETRLRAGLKIGVIGLGLGLLGASLYIIPQQLPANAVLKVFAEARTGLLTERFEREAWPADAELTAALGPEWARRLRVLITECPLAGTWRFAGAKAGGAPAILFTPAEPGQAYERCLRLVDTWIDDGDPAAGDFVVGPDYARLRLSAE